MNAVDKVVGRHDAAHPALLHRSLERRQVDLVQSAFVHFRTDVMTVPFLVVAGKVFDRGEHLLRLNAPDHRRHHLAGQKGIFTHVFEIAPAQRRAIDIHRRSEQNIHAARPTIAPQTLPDSFGHLTVPRGRQRNTSRVTRRGAVVAAAHRPIRHFDGRDPEPLDGADVKPLRAADVIDFLLERHAREQVIHPLFHRLGRIEIQWRCGVGFNHGVGRRHLPRARQHRGAGNNDPGDSAGGVLWFHGAEEKGGNEWRLVH